MLGCFLLTLTTLACRQREGGGSNGPAPKPTVGIEPEELLELIHKSDRPYVLVNFFATWCGPCRREIPDLVEMQDDPNSEANVVLISIDSPSDAKSKLRDFLTDMNVSFPTYARTQGEAAFIKRFYPVWDGRIPLTLIYDQKGNQLEAIRGLTERAEIELIMNKHKMMGS